MEKACRTCGEVKELNPDNFYRHGTNTTGFNTQCKMCASAQQKSYRTKANRRTKKEQVARAIKIKRLDESCKYEIKKKENLRAKEEWYGNKFVGKVIYQDKRLLTLRNDSGIVETFLKIDFVIGDYQYKAI